MGGAGKLLLHAIFYLVFFFSFMIQCSPSDNLGMLYGIPYRELYWF